MSEFNTPDIEKTGYLRVENGNVGVDSTLRPVVDGNQNESALEISTTGVNINGDFTVGGDPVGSPTQAIGVACSDETTALEVDTAVATFRMPYAFTLTEVRASVGTAPVGAAIEVDINANGESILTDPITIDAGDKTSVGSAAPAVIATSALADDAEITVDIDQIGSGTAGAGLKVWLIGTRNAN